MIKIRTKANFLSIFIIIVLTIITIVGFMCCEHKPKMIMETDKQPIEKTIEENNITIDIETDKDGDTNQAIKPVSLGEFKLTAYCSCEICCNEYAYNRPTDENGNEIIYGAIGEELKEGYSIAVDPSVIPYRSKVIINGNVYEAQDCGGAIKGNRIDLYFKNHQDALDFGVQYTEVFVIKN